MLLPVVQKLGDLDGKKAIHWLHPICQADPTVNLSVWDYYTLLTACLEKTVASYIFKRKEEKETKLTTAGCHSSLSSL